VLQRVIHDTQLAGTPRVSAVAAPAAHVIGPHKKIDWHDYTLIARDEQRTGNNKHCSVVK